MTAMAVFGADGQWLTSSVCPSTGCPSSSALGVHWGRAFDPLSDHHPEDLAASLSTVSTWLGPCTQEHFRPTTAMVSGTSSGLDFGQHQIVSQEAGALLVLEGQVLVWLCTADGHTGLLLEAGEWVCLPGNVAHAVDAGRQPGLELLLLGAGPRGWFPQWTGQRLPGHLPSLDDFVCDLLGQLGEEMVEEGD